MFADGVRNGAVVVAHPDDETLWAGGLLARYPDRWTVICCSIPKTDPVRAWKFFAACEVLGATARLVPFTESGASAALENLGLLDLTGFDCIVTHNSAGEYGHRHHVDLNRFITERWGQKTFTFGWRADGRGSIVLHLGAEERERKLAALRCHDHVSPSDGQPKWKALIERYALDFRTETFDPPSA